MKHDDLCALSTPQWKDVLFINREAKAKQGNAGRFRKIVSYVIGCMNVLNGFSFDDKSFINSFSSEQSSKTCANIAI